MAYGSLILTPALLITEEIGDNFALHRTGILLVFASSHGNPWCIFLKISPFEAILYHGHLLVRSEKVAFHSKIGICGPISTLSQVEKV